VSLVRVKIANYKKLIHFSYRQFDRNWSVINIGLLIYIKKEYSIVVILCDNCKFPIPVGSLLILTFPTHSTSEMCGKVAA
jgi:hypothetical protein